VSWELVDWAIVEVRARRRGYMQTYRAGPKGRAATQAQAERRADQRDRIADIKVAAGCVDCGYNEHPAALEFDHVPERGPKLFAISQADFRHWEDVLAEIAKCEIRCARCHAVRTAERHAARGASYCGRWSSCV